jgi:hypothetical protein
MTEDRHPHRSLLDANACCVTHTRWTWLDLILWGSRMSCGNRPVDMMGNKVEGRMFFLGQSVGLLAMGIWRGGLYTAPPACASGLTTGPSHT